ncbi:polymorphic toxin-type HINT domain-containing protein [Nocardiopsis flavescens]|uniref:polymorphic toxin-type HINT domain-containing protein n=1 Tax=Nocardiopsis flavescens TaxID=758803 RepID=UPI000933B3CB|nr:polymorphic toxin-type HINT domain-containing protein [Nocardiopsis flavescens]
MVEVDTENAGLPGPVMAGDVVIATEGHPFWVPGLKAWVDAIDLVPGMWLQTSAGTWVQINAIQGWSQPATVHNLTVQGVHTYHVATGSLDVLNHNCGGEPPEALLDFADEALSMMLKSDQTLRPWLYLKLMEILSRFGLTLRTLELEVCPPRRPMRWLFLVIMEDVVRSTVRRSLNTVGLLSGGRFSIQ